MIGTIRKCSAKVGTDGAITRGFYRGLGYSEIGQRSNDNSVQKCVQTIYKAIENIMKVCSVLCYSLLSLASFVMAFNSIFIIMLSFYNC